MNCAVFMTIVVSCENRKNFLFLQEKLILPRFLCNKSGKCDVNKTTMKIDSGKKVRTVSGENIVIMHAAGMADMTQVVALNASAMELYNALKEREFTDEDVVQTLLDIYDVDEPTARRDAADWVGQMRKEGLIVA